MKRYYKQQEAFDAAESKTDVCVFQNQTYGRRYYVVCDNRTYWDTFLSKGDIYGYELIRRNAPCHLYIDLDINLETFPSINVFDIWLLLEKYIDRVLSDECGFDHIVKHVMHANSLKKGSMHIVYNIKNRMFESNAHCGAFMRAIRAIMESNSDATMFDEKWVDMCVYSPNRLFRMLGCTKYGQDRPLLKSGAVTYEDWKSCKIQPSFTKGTCNYAGVFVEIVELDGSQPSYSRTSTGISGWFPGSIHSIKDYIEEKHARIAHTHSYALQHIFVFNLNLRDCPFKGESHSKSQMYTVVNMANNTYKLRCHSKQCKNCETESFAFDDNVKNDICLWLNREIRIPAII